MGGKEIDYYKAVSKIHVKALKYRQLYTYLLTPSMRDLMESLPPEKMEKLLDIIQQEDIVKLKNYVRMEICAIEDWTLIALREEAKRLGVSNYSRLDRIILVKILTEYQNETKQREITGSNPEFSKENK